MWGCSDRHDPVRRCCATDLDCLVQVDGAVVDRGQYVRVEVDHAREVYLRAYFL
jgi:hypothetical protein